RAPILWRILLYAVSEDPSRSDDNRVRIILDNGWLINPALKAETEKIISNSLRTTSTSVLMEVAETIERELDRLSRVPDLSDGQRSNPATGEILSAIQKSGVASPEIRKLVKLLEEKERS
ncbi:MAG TPA: hypothetical protein P5212_11385, partial [Mesotoga sp.]|nr:hypothetical protein [Mesotoga sp.]